MSGLDVAQAKVTMLNVLALLGGCSTADESLAWAIEKGYVSSTGKPFDSDDAFRITPEGEAEIRRAVEEGVLS